MYTNMASKPESVKRGDTKVAHSLLRHLLDLARVMQTFSNCRTSQLLT